MSDRFAIFLRHGDYHQKPDTPSALQPFALTETGRQQADACGRELADLVKETGWALEADIFCSRLQRAWQTAAGVSHALTDATGRSFQVVEEEDLAERSVGALANLTTREIEDVLAADPRHAPPPDDWKSNSHYRLPVQGAESLMEAGRRVADFVSARTCDMERMPHGTACLFVGHGASLRHAAHHLGVLAFDDIRRLSMYHARPVVLRLAADESWTHHRGAWKERRTLEPALD